MRKRERASPSGVRSRRDVQEGDEPRREGGRPGENRDDRQGRLALHGQEAHGPHQGDLGDDPEEARDRHLTFSLFMKRSKTCISAIGE